MSDEVHSKYQVTEWGQEVAYVIDKNMKYNPKCLCDNTACARHSNCRLCMEFHSKTGHPPTCRYKWKWDNSIPSDNK